MKKQYQTREGSTLKIDYILQDAGWGILKIEYNEIYIEHDISYLNDSLKEFIDVTNLFIKQKAKIGKIVFMSEPGELHLLLEKIDDEFVKLKVHRFEDWASWNMWPEDRFDSLLEIDISLNNWSQIVLANVEKIYIEHGIQTYKEKWINNDFPFYEYCLLKKLVEKQ